jgi:hypothetical protein
MKMTVKALKLTTSEEVVGEVVSETDDAVALKNVVVVAIQPGPDGRAALGFLPFMPYLGKDKTITFSAKNIILCEAVDDQMANQYNSVFGGIVVPPKQLITG